jgi:DMSO/TMAO reductase YedYZ molybdopterin-dependent catalytic subunit
VRRVARSGGEFRQRFASRSTAEIPAAVPLSAVAVMATPERPADGPAESTRPAPPASSTIPRWAATVSGVVAAGTALGVGELVTGLAGAGPTLVEAVGTEFIDRYAASLKDLAVALFGTNDKAALIVGIVVLSLLFGAVLGRAAARRRWIGVVGLAAFGLVGLLAYLGDPQGGTGTGVAAALLAVVTGSVSLLGLLHVASSLRPAGGAVPPPVSPVRTSRRSFVVSAGVLAAGAVGASVLGRRVGSTDVVDATRRRTVLPRATVASAAPASTGAPAIDGLSPYVTPTADFYRIDTALSTPQVDAGSWRLEMTGMVDRPLSITYDELLAMDAVEDVVTLQCVSNEVGGNLVGNAVWQGVPLATLLERAGVQPGAGQVVGRSVDDFTAGFPIDVALDGRTAMVVYAMNGEPLRARHGFPVRLIVAGLYGYVSATKWLRQIELTTWDGFDGYWVPRGWSKEGPIKPQSRIDVPRGGAELAAGPQVVAGVAWAPIEGIGGIEVQVDEGEWRAASLGEAASGNTWVQWWLDWDATPGEHAIQARAITAGGVTQTEQRRPPIPDGATGWHRRTVRVA